MKYSDLTPELERELVARYQAGDREAALVLVETLERLLWSSVRRYVSKSSDHRDVRQTLHTCILEGARRFRPDDGYRLYTYVQKYSGGLFIKHIASDTLIAVRRAADRKARTFRQAGVEVPESVQLRLQLRRTTSLDAPIGDGAVTLHDVLHDEAADPLERVSADDRRAELVEQLMRSLPPREADVVRAYYLRDDAPTMPAIGAEMGMSKQAVHQNIERAMFKLRRAVRSVMTEDDAALWGGRTTPPASVKKPGSARVSTLKVEPRSAILRLVHTHGESTLHELVDRLDGRVSRKLVYSTMAAMLSEGLVSSRVDEADARLRPYRLTDAGRAALGGARAEAA